MPKEAQIRVLYVQPFIVPTKSTEERYRYPYTFSWTSLRMYHYPMILISYSA